MSDGFVARAPDRINTPRNVVFPLSHETLIKAQHEWAFITFQAVYNFIRHDGIELVNFDLMHQFCVDAQFESMPVYRYKLDKPIFTSEIADCYEVLAIPIDCLEPVKRWITASMFHYKDSWYRVQVGTYSLLVHDCVAAKITLFLPKSNKHRIRVEVKNGIPHLTAERHNDPQSA